jgi:hypothetical protein
MSLALPVAVLAGYGLADLLRWVRQRERWGAQWGALLPIAAGAAIAFEYLTLPLPLQPAALSPFYGELAAEGVGGAVLNVPVDPYDSKPYMYAQTVHGWPIMQGRLSRYPQGVFDALDAQPWIAAVRAYGDIPPRQPDLGRHLAALSDLGVPYLIVNKEMMAGHRATKWARYMAYVPRYEDASIAVYRTTPAAGRDFQVQEMAPGLGPISVHLASPCLQPGGELSVDVAWGAAFPPGRDLEVELALLPAGGDEAVSAAYPLSDGWPLGEWPAGAVAWGWYALELPGEFPLGTARVRLSLVDPATGRIAGEPLFAGQVEVRDAPCPADPPPGMVGVDARFGEEMRLLGYRLQEEGKEIELTLAWRAERRMGIDYKVFVHVYDPATGIPAVQDDAMPLHWTYPTTYWDPGEVVPDPIRLSLSGAPPGTYALAVGVYDPATMDRLPVADRDGTLQPEGRLTLAGEQVQVE